jgi:hypothetical protein
MTKLEKAMHWVYRYKRGERDFAGCPGDHDIGDTKIVVGHLLTLAKELERIHCEALKAELNTATAVRKKR